MTEPAQLPAVQHPKAGQHGEVVTLKSTALEAALREAHDRGCEKGAKAERLAVRKSLEAIDAQRVDELQRLNADIVHRERAAHAHGFHKAGWMFGFSGFVLGVVLTLMGGLVWLRIGTEATVSGVAAGSMARDQQNNVDALERLRSGEP
ncbi:hypothetical protein [Vitreimonas flagellata]|uniref:hypothetical protein n=1 Tax=Vitreimonas flagellata TaxID=2560861 RepID=UPI001074A170|nr:hypothetical protein [Vitreimonas flagellata]